MFPRSTKFIAILTMLMTMGAGCISFNSNTTVATPMGMFRSMDKAETWTQINSYPTSQGVKSLSGVQISRFFFDPSDPNALYMGTRGQGLYYSYDKGDTWRYADSLGQRFITTLAVDPQNKCVIYAADQTLHMFKSTDCSRSWTQIYSDVRSDVWVVALSVDTKNRRIYAALRSGELMVSADAGASWQLIHRFRTQLAYMVVDPKNPDRVYVASPSGGMARSDDAGQTWISLADGLDKYNDAKTFYRMVLHPTDPDTLFWISKYGILKSTDAGKTWNNLNVITAPGSVTVYAFALNPKNANEIYYVGSVIGNGAARSSLYKTSDGGNKWVSKKLPSAALPVYMAVNPADGNQVYLGYMAVPKQ